MLRVWVLVGFFNEKLRLAPYEKAHLVQAKYMTGLHRFTTHAVLPSTPLTGIGLSSTAVPTFFLTGSSSNSPNRAELQTNPNSTTYLPPSKRLMRSDTLLDFSFATLETGVGVSSSILGF